VPARCMAPRSPACSACAPSSCRRDPACSPRSGARHRRAATRPHEPLAPGRPRRRHRHLRRPEARPAPGRAEGVLARRAAPQLGGRYRRRDSRSPSLSGHDLSVEGPSAATNAIAASTPCPGGLARGDLTVAEASGGLRRSTGWGPAQAPDPSALVASRGPGAPRPPMASSPVRGFCGEARAGSAACTSGAGRLGGVRDLAREVWPRARPYRVLVVEQLTRRPWCCPASATAGPHWQSDHPRPSARDAVKGRARAGVSDPVTRGLRGAPAAQAREAVIERTAMSPFIREKKDCRGHLTTTPRGVAPPFPLRQPHRDHLRPVPARDDAPGRFYWYAMPRLRGGMSHSPDMVFAAPVFHRRLVAFSRTGELLGYRRLRANISPATEIFLRASSSPPSASTGRTAQRRSLRIFPQLALPGDPQG
jgi:hypothetical protein